MCRVEDPETAAAERTEETGSLAPTTARKQRRRKRGPSLPSGADWKPSLGAISEEKVVLVVMEREKSDDRTAESERSVKRKNGSRDDRAHVRNNSNEFRYLSVQKFPLNLCLITNILIYLIP